MIVLSVLQHSQQSVSSLKLNLLNLISYDVTSSPGPRLEAHFITREHEILRKKAEQNDKCGLCDELSVSSPDTRLRSLLFTSKSEPRGTQTNPSIGSKLTIFGART